MPQVVARLSQLEDSSFSSHLNKARAEWKAAVLEVANFPAHLREYAVEQMLQEITLAFNGVRIASKDKIQPHEMHQLRRRD